MDLSTAFDSLNHELLLTKLKAYGLDSNSVTYEKLSHKQTSTL